MVNQQNLNISQFTGRNKINKFNAFQGGREFFYIRLDSKNLTAMLCADLFYDLKGRTLPQIIDIRLKGESITCYCYFRLIFLRELTGKPLNSSKYPVDNPMRLAIIYLPGGMDESCLLRRFGNDKPWINSNTVAADTRTRLQDIDPGMSHTSISS